jgi:hypothetical protein
MGRRTERGGRVEKKGGVGKGTERERETHKLCKLVRHPISAHRGLPLLVRNLLAPHPLANTLLIVHPLRRVEERIRVGLRGLSEVEGPCEGRSVSSAGEERKEGKVERKEESKEERKEGRKSRRTTRNLLLRLLPISTTVDLLRLLGGRTGTSVSSIRSDVSSGRAFLRVGLGDRGFRRLLTGEN